MRPSIVGPRRRCNVGTATGCTVTRTALKMIVARIEKLTLLVRRTADRQTINVFRSSDAGCTVCPSTNHEWQGSRPNGCCPEQIITVIKALYRHIFFVAWQSWQTCQRCPSQPCFSISLSDPHFEHFFVMGTGLLNYPSAQIEKGYLGRVH